MIAPRAAARAAVDAVSTLLFVAVALPLSVVCDLCDQAVHDLSDDTAALNEATRRLHALPARWPLLSAFGVGAVVLVSWILERAA